MQKRRDETTACPVNVNRNIKAALLFQIVERQRDFTHRFILERVCYAKRWYHTDRIFIAALDDFIAGHQEPAAFAGNLAQFHVEVTGKPGPASMNGAADNVRLA